MLEKIKLYFAYFWRMLAFSMLSWMLAEALALPLVSLWVEEGENKFMLTSGPYFWFVALMCILIFYSFMFLWIRRQCRTPDKMPFCKGIKALQENQAPFNWATQYKKSIRETLEQEVWAYAIWCIFPTITCASSWCIGYRPQTLIRLELPNSGFITNGMSLFRAQHFFFDLFSPLGIFSVPLGLFVGVAFFVVIYSFIITLMKEKIYYGSKEKSRKVFVVTVSVAILLIVAIIGFLFVILSQIYRQY